MYQALNMQVVPKQVLASQNKRISTLELPGNQMKIPDILLIISMQPNKI